MASDEQMTEYERRRLENIKRNTQMFTFLNVRARLSDLSASSQRQRAKKKTCKTSSERNKPKAPVVIRSSLRTRGVAPDSNELPKKFKERKVKSKKLLTWSSPRPVARGLLSMKDAYDMEEGSYRAIVEKFTNVTKSQANWEGTCRTRSMANGTSRLPSKVERVNLEEPIDVNSLNLDSGNIARFVLGSIFSIRFFPTTAMTMVVVGNKYGQLSFWDVKPQNENEDIIHLYKPHSDCISGISVHPFSLSKVYTSSYDGLIRLMDFEREEFNQIYLSSSESPLFSLSQQPNDAHSLYLGEGQGDLNVVDARVRKITNSWSLHEDRINTIDFNSANPNIMVTSSTDGLACLWDLRKMDVKHSECTALESLKHGRAVHSAYFSPSGSSMATSSDDNIGVLCGVNFEDKFMIPHDNQTNRRLSSIRAIWGWEDTHLFVGSTKRRVDVVSVKQRKTVSILESPLVSAIPWRCDAHPCNVGMLAGATSGGQVYLWTAPL